MTNSINRNTILINSLMNNVKWSRIFNVYNPKKFSREINVEISNSKAKLYFYHEILQHYPIFLSKQILKWTPQNDNLTICVFISSYVKLYKYCNIQFKLAVWFFILHLLIGYFTCNLKRLVFIRASNYKS